MNSKAMAGMVHAYGNVACFTASPGGGCSQAFSNKDNLTQKEDFQTRSIWASWASCFTVET